MNANERVQVVLELLEGRATAAELAQRHGVTEAEVHAWRDVFLSGARSASTPAPSRRGSWAAAALGGAVLVGLLAGPARAQVCSAPASFTALGLTWFCPDAPALASEVNGNTQQLVALMQQKLGNTWGAADAGAGTSGISTATVSTNTVTTTSATLSGNASFGSTTRQMLNLWGTQYGIGVQGNTTYFRSGGNFAWYVGGTHHDGELNPGGGTAAMVLRPDGALSVRGLKQIDSAAPAVAPYELQRFIVDATPTAVGSAVTINQAALDAICRDDDGCPFTISMVNWNNDGMVATRSGTLFLNQRPGFNAWRLELDGSDIQGVDGNNAVEEMSAWDCYFGDSAATDANNNRNDPGLGFSLLNCRGCNYSDTNMTCRMVFRD